MASSPDQAGDSRELPPAGSRTRTVRRAGRFAVWAFRIAIAGGVGFYAYFGRFGFPRPLTRWICDRMGTATTFVAADSMRPGFPDRLRATGLRLFRKGVTGPPDVRVESLSGKLDLRNCLRGNVRVREIRARGVAVRPGPSLAALAREWFRPDAGRRPDWTADWRCRLVIQGLDLQGVWVERLVGGVSGAERRLVVELEEGTVGRVAERGSVTASLVSEAPYETYRGRVETRVDPRVLLPLVPPAATGLRRTIERFVFNGAPPACRADLEWRTGENWSVILETACEGRHLTYRGAGFDFVDALMVFSFSPTNEVFDVRRLTATRGGGKMEGAFAVDFCRNRVSFYGEADTAPETVAAVLGPFASEFVRRFEFDPPVVMTARGEVNPDDPRVGTIEGFVSGRGLKWGRLVFDDYSSRVERRGLAVRLADIGVGLAGGIGGGEADFQVGFETSTVYRAQWRLVDADLTGLAKMLGAREPQRYEGKISVRGDIEGGLGENAAAAAAGKGRLKIRNGRIFRLPLFGGLSDILGKIIPGLNWVLQQTDASCKFVVRDGAVRTRDLLVEGDLFSLTGEGEYYFDGRIDFDVQIKLLKEKTFGGQVLRLLLDPVSKIFEFRLRGTTEKHRWYPKNFSPEVLKRLGIGAEEG